MSLRLYSLKENDNFTTNIFFFLKMCGRPEEEYDEVKLKSFWLHCCNLKTLEGSSAPFKLVMMWLGDTHWLLHDLHHMVRFSWMLL